jgi:hypothetical protein
MNVQETGAVLAVNSAGLANKLQILTAGGKVMSILGYNSKASAQWIQVFDSATTPAGANVPLFCLNVPANSQFSIDWWAGRPFVSGCIVVNSTTAATYTAGAADCFFDATCRTKF